MNSEESLNINVPRLTASCSGEFNSDLHTIRVLAVKGRARSRNEMKESTGTRFSSKMCRTTTRRTIYLYHTKCVESNRKSFSSTPVVVAPPWLLFPFARRRAKGGAMGCQASRPQVEREGEASAFCTAAGLPQYAENFARAGYDDRITLAALTDDDLETVR